MELTKYEQKKELRKQAKRHIKFLEDLIQELTANPNQNIFVAHVNPKTKELKSTIAGFHPVEFLALLSSFADTVSKNIKVENKT